MDQGHAQPARGNFTNGAVLPTNQAGTNPRHILLSRRISESEWLRAVTVLEEFDMENGWMQEFDGAPITIVLTFPILPLHSLTSGTSGRIIAADSTRSATQQRACLSASRGIECHG